MPSTKISPSASISPSSHNGIVSSKSMYSSNSSVYKSPKDKGSLAALDNANIMKTLANWSTYLFIIQKSTRLNSSHVSISYAVFCLKKKKQPILYDSPLRCYQP